MNPADPAFESIEASILPNAALLLDALIDSAVLALPGLDCAAYADELRSLASQVDDLTRRVAALAPVQPAERLRMSA
jgi:hypothetical protein